MPRAARHYQRRDSQLRLLADHGAPGIRREIKAALQHLGSLVPRETALRNARAGDWHGLVAHIDWTHARQIFRGVFARIGKLRHAAAELGVQKINGSFNARRRRVRFRKASETLHNSGALRGGGASSPSPRADASAVTLKAYGDQFNFDLYDADTLASIRASQDELITALEESARDAIEVIIADAAEQGLGPEEIVDDIRDLIGLTDRQAQATLNYERMLRDLDPDALERALRNSDYDAAVQDAIDSGEDLAEVAITNMVEDYISNSLDFRADMIAGTESTRAVNDGLQSAYEQAIDRGALPSEAIRQFWLISLDEKTCPVCTSIPDMNPDGVEIGEAFNSVDGPQDGPPDPHPACRCEIEIVTDLDKVPGDEEE